MHSSGRVCTVTAVNLMSLKDSPSQFRTLTAVDRMAPKLPYSLVAVMDYTEMDSTESVQDTQKQESFELHAVACEDIVATRVQTPMGRSLVLAVAILAISMRLWLIAGLWHSLCPGLAGTTMVLAVYAAMHVWPSRIGLRFVAHLGCVALVVLPLLTFIRNNLTCSTAELALLETQLSSGESVVGLVVMNVCFGVWLGSLSAEHASLLVRVLTATLYCAVCALRVLCYALRIGEGSGHILRAQQLLIASTIPFLLSSIVVHFCVRMASERSQRSRGELLRADAEQRVEQLCTMATEREDQLRAEAKEREAILRSCMHMANKRAKSWNEALRVEGEQQDATLRAVKWRQEQKLSMQLELQQARDEAIQLQHPAAP